MADFEKVYSIKFDISKADKSLDKLEDALKRIEKSSVFFQMQAISKVLKEIDQNAQQASKTIRNELGREARKNLDALGKSGKQAANDLERIPVAAKRVNISLTDIGRNLNKYVLAPLAAMSGLSIKAAMDMNKGMANVSTLVEKSPDQLLEMKRQAQDTMVAMGKGTQDVTDGLYQVISALGESEQNMQQLQGATKAAVAGLSDTKSSVEMLTAVAKAYNDTSAKSIEHTSDLAFQTVKLGVTTFPELAASIGKVAPLAAQFNTSQEELFGTMATLTGVTGSTAEVVTQLASVYSAFMNPSEEMDKALKNINKSLGKNAYESIQAMVKEEGLTYSIQQLGIYAKGSEKKLFEMFRRKEALLAILPLLSTQSENWGKKLLAMKDASGATDEAFRKQTEGINKQGFELEQTKQRVIVFGQRIGDRLIPMLGKAVEFGNRVLDWLDSMDDGAIAAAISIGKVVAQFVLFTNALRGINTIGGGVLSFLGSASGEFGSFGGSIDNAKGKVSAFTKTLGLMQKGLATIGLIGAGYTLEELIRIGLVEPAMAAGEAKRQGSENKAIDTVLHAKELSGFELEQRKKQAISELQDIQRKQGGGPSLMSAMGFQGTMAGPVGAYQAQYEELSGDAARRAEALAQSIGAIQQEQQRRYSGISALEGYYSERVKGVSETQYFDAAIVRNAQLKAAGGMTEGISQTQSYGYEQVANPINITSNVTINKQASKEEIRRQTQKAIGNTIVKQLNMSGEF